MYKHNVAKAIGSQVRIKPVRITFLDSQSMATGSVDAKVRQLERKADGSSPDAPAGKAAKPAEEEEVTPSWVSALMMKMDAVETKMDAVTSKVDEAVKTSTEAKEGVKAVEAQVKAVKDDIAKEKEERKEWQSAMEEKVSAAEYMDPATEARPPDPIVHKKISEIEKTLAKMSVCDPWANAAANRAAGGATGGAQREGQSVATVIFGRLDKESTTEDAAVWLDAQLSKNGVPKPVNTFIKDENYKGRLWARFPTVEAMDAAILMFQNKTLMHGGGADGKAWCNKDRPHHERTARGFLVGLKRLLVEWKFNKKALQFDDDTMILTVEKSRLSRYTRMKVI